MDTRQRLRELIAQREFEQLRALADSGDGHARRVYAHLLRLRQDEAALRDRAEYLQLAHLLAHQDRLDELRTLVDSLYPQAEHVLVDLLAQREDLDELARRGQAGSRHIANILVAQGRIDELRARADAGDYPAFIALAQVLADRKDVDGLTALKDNRFAERKLIEVLTDAKRYPEAIALQRARAGRRRDWVEDSHLVRLLNLAGLEEELRERAETDETARDYLVRLYARQERVDELRAIADTGHKEAKRRLIEVFVERADVAELEKYPPTSALVGVYRRLGRLDEVREMARDAIGNARHQLAEMLRERDLVGELRELAADPDHPAVRELVRWLAEHGHVDELDALSRTGDSWALAALAKLAPERLWPRAQAGDERVVRQLARAYREQRNVDGLRKLAALGDRQVQRDFLGLLRGLGHEGELAARADVDEPEARSYWIRHLASSGRLDDLRALADAGDGSAAVLLVEKLAEDGRLDEVVARAEAGDKHAAWQLACVIVPVVSDNPEDRVRP